MKRFIWLGVASSMVLGLNSVRAELSPGGNEAPQLTIKHNGKAVGNPFIFEEIDGVFKVINPGGRVLPDQANFDVITINEVTINTDPFITYSFSVVDNGGASDFEFIFDSPINPQISNPADVFASIAYSVTPSFNLGNSSPIEATLTPLQGNLQISELGFQNAFENAGVDVGNGQTVPGPATLAFSDEAGFFTTSATGPFDSMRVTTSFSLSGNGAAAGGSGRFEIIPEPATSMLVGLGLVGLVALRRRS